MIQGFVEELVVNEDPDYQWIDKIRSMRASNEARQVAFSKLSGNALSVATHLSWSSDHYVAVNLDVVSLLTFR